MCRSEELTGQFTLRVIHESGYIKSNDSEHQIAVYSNGIFIHFCFKQNEYIIKRN